jgi:hypothetical protein
VLQIDVENFVHHATSPGPVFFERGVLDALCALDQITPLNEGELNMWLSNYQYLPKVFVLPPWKAIYENDAERDQTFGHAEGPITVRGAAWAGEAPVTKVDVSTDNGRTWHTAKLGADQAKYAWRLWEFMWHPPGAGSYVLMA